jgi:hypothetical protein
MKTFLNTIVLLLLVGFFNSCDQIEWVINHRDIEPEEFRVTDTIYTDTFFIYPEATFVDYYGEYQQDREYQEFNVDSIDLFFHTRKFNHFTINTDTFAFIGGYQDTEFTSTELHGDVSVPAGHVLVVDTVYATNFIRTNYAIFEHKSPAWSGWRMDTVRFLTGSAYKKWQYNADETDHPLRSYMAQIKEQYNEDLPYSKYLDNLLDTLHVESSSASIYLVDVYFFMETPFGGYNLILKKDK